MTQDPPARTRKAARATRARTRTGLRAEEVDSVSGSCPATSPACSQVGLVTAAWRSPRQDGTARKLRQRLVAAPPAAWQRPVTAISRLQDARRSVERMIRCHGHSRARLAHCLGVFPRGAVGTAPMDLVQFARYRRGGGNDRLLAWEFSAGLKGWGQAPAPAHIGKRVVERVFQRRLPPERAALVNNLMHWGYGMAWGGLFGPVAGSLRSPRIRDGLALGASVWTASYVLLPLARLYRPIWEYDARVLARDLGDHLVYGLGAAGADRLLAGRRVG